MDSVIDWGAGNYDRIANELDPVAQLVVDEAKVQPGEWVVDVACGTGNAALLAAARGAGVIGVDSAPSLLEVARQRAHADGVEVEFREGDLLDLPLTEDAADVVLSVFGVVFAAQPRRAVEELARIVRPDGRVLVSAWVPAGPIDAMLSAMGRIVGGVSRAPARPRFGWSQPAVVRAQAAEAGLSLVRTISAELAITDSSPEAYVDAGQQHPVALSMRPVLEQAGAADEVRTAMLAVLGEANEDPSGFLVHSPYVVHELRLEPADVRQSHVD